MKGLTVACQACGSFFQWWISLLFYIPGDAEGENSGELGEVRGERCKCLGSSRVYVRVSLSMKRLVWKDAFLCSHQGKLPLLLSRMNEVAKVFLATNSDYKYTDVSKNQLRYVKNKVGFYLDLKLRCFLTENHDLPVWLSPWPKGKIKSEQFCR